MRFFHEVVRSPRALKALAASGAVFGLLLLGLLVTPAVVRGKVERSARARGFEARVESVTWGLGRLWLRRVNVSEPGQDFEVELDAVAVGLFGGSVQVSGGSVRGAGDPARVLRKLQGNSGEERRGPSEGGRDIVAEGIQVRWREGGRLAEVFGARGSRTGSELQFGAELARVAEPTRSVEARGLEAAVVSRAQHRQLTRFQTRSLEVTWRSAEEPNSSRSAAGAASPRASPDVARGDRAAQLRALRELILPLARAGLADDARLTLDGVSARVERAGETLSFGPSRLVLSRQADSLLVSLMPSVTDAGVTPLALSLSLPLSNGRLAVNVKGGPVSLSSLGVRAGQLGLRNVRQASLAADGSAEFSDDFESVELRGKLSVAALSLDRKELSSEPIGPWSFDAALTARARLDGRELAISSGELHWGELRVELSGEVHEAAERRRVQGRLRVPLAGCQSLLEAMPNGLLPLVRGMRMSGSFGVDLQVRYDESAPKDTSVRLSVQNECRVREVPAHLSPRRFEQPFLREVKAADGSPTSIESGPGTPSWASLDDISRHMETAILICEDAGFHAHAGFDYRALENAIKDDLKQGRFARGASTVSMQLAKNLYLGREKTLSRKIQEAWLTMLLEQQLDKRRILELYLNVVELGPGLYGVADAAQYYFATSARSLSLGQSLYLASLLPNPTFSHFRPDGKLSAAWLDYLHRLMHIAHKIKRIDDAELEAALAEEIAFRVPGQAPARDDAVEPDAPPPPELEDAGVP